jgi:hypothetical protein
MSYFSQQAISGTAFSPAVLRVSARTVSGSNVLVNLTAAAPFQSRQVVGVLYNAPLSAVSTLTTIYSAFGTTFELNRAFNNQTVALLLRDNGTVEFTALSSATTVSLSTLSSASTIAYNDSWPELQRKVDLCMQ